MQRPRDSLVWHYNISEVPGGYHWLVSGSLTFKVSLFMTLEKTNWYVLETISQMKPSVIRALICDTHDPNQIIQKQRLNKLGTYYSVIRAVVQTFYLHWTPSKLPPRAIIIFNGCRCRGHYGTCEIAVTIIMFPVFRLGMKNHSRFDIKTK